MSIIINGKKVASGKNISMINGRVFINGVEIKDVDNVDGKKYYFNITIEEGTQTNIDIEHAEEITVNGNVNYLKTVSGDVKCTGDITGDVNTTSGDVQCKGNIMGNVRSISGDIERW